MTAEALLARFRDLSALVVGDVCLDRWCTFDPRLAEPSRETGIPRIGVTGVETTAGAGGTVANNLAALGAGRVVVLGVVGDDGHGFELRRALSGRGIESDLLVEAASQPTFTYTKLINRETGEEDRARVDFLYTHAQPVDIETEIAQRLRASAAAFDVILISDQAETDQGGAVTGVVREAVAEVAAAFPQKVVWVDSRRRAELFRGALVKPNEQEAAEACLRAFGRIDYAALRTLIGDRPLIVTHGDRGALVVDAQGETWAAARGVANPVDICGAGDSFSAGGALALAATGSAVEAARFGNLVASITIMKKGTGTASPAEVLAAAAEWR